MHATMPSLSRSRAILALAVVFCSPGHHAAADTWEETGGKVFDVAILRTGGLIRTCVGGVFLIGAYPLSLIGEAIELAVLDDPPAFGKGRSRDSFEFLVSEPFEDTFQRSLGDF